VEAPKCIQRPDDAIFVLHPSEQGGLGTTSKLTLLPGQNNRNVAAKPVSNLPVNMNLAKKMQWANIPSDFGALSPNYSLVFLRDGRTLRLD
jgi:hypothetical protein